MSLASCSTKPSLSPKKRPTIVFSIMVFSSRVAGSGGGAEASARNSAGSETSLERARNMSTSNRHSSAFVASASARRISRDCSTSDAGIARAGDGLRGGTAGTFTTFAHLEDTRGGTCTRDADSIWTGEGGIEGAREGGADEATGDVGPLSTHSGAEED